MKKLFLLSLLAGLALGMRTPAQAIGDGGGIPPIVGGYRCPNGSPPRCMNCTQYGACVVGCIGGMQCRSYPTMCQITYDCVQF